MVRLTTERDTELIVIRQFGGKKDFPRLRVIYVAFLEDYVVLK